MSESILQIQDLRFSYSSQRGEILNIKSMVIQRGEKVFLFGPSGTGKTTLLEMIAGILKPQAGSLKILGQHLESMTQSQRDHFRAQHLGFIFQNFNLVPYLSVLENVMLGLSFSSHKQKKLGSTARTQAMKLLESLGLAHLAEENVSELSVGQGQRVAVARALLGEPEMILADEPTSALDKDHRDQFLKLLFELCAQHKITLVFVSHDRSLAAQFDRQISLLEVNGGGR